MSVNIGARLKQIRESLALDREKMARLLGIRKSGYCKNERGESMPRFKSLYIIAVRLGIAMDWFLLGRGPVYFKDVVKEAEKKEVKEPPAPRPISSAERMGKRIESDADVNEMVSALLEVPMVKHQLLADFQRCKSQHGNLM
ncbi:MAG: helix-turn-helix transcriptional regulator [bacterium]|nr:helix-turn-helix transcriptional regulator [bacterium]